ncbi:hypothetical protein ACHAWT_005857 [Skeletonema menzelii]|mmetsp:Transcript_8440/g.13881  ORF Transcript_8440/g.13881 Transcript_8440/m.13881 type:complete len:391 (+) Transcript_8440:138-1310(+)
MKRKVSLIVALAAVIIRLLWSLDANPLLLIYDAYLTISAAIGTTDARNDDARRIFGLDATSLEGKTVWITGSSSGIGAELAVQLVLAGVGHLILSGRRVDLLNKVAKTCRESQIIRADALGKDRNIDISLLPFDLGQVEELDGAVTSALEAAPETGIDIIILNAGQYHCAPALETNVDEALPDLMQVNFASPVQLAHKLLHKDRWKERRYGHIVAISSLMGRGAAPLNAAYSASKHALRGYFLSLAAEESSWLRVDVVLPGATNTGLWEASWNSKSEDVEENSSSKQLQADDRSKMPVKRCAQLILSSMIAPSYLLFNEIWISRNPGLLWVYLASYSPCIFHVMTSIIAPFRRSMWERNGEDALYLPTMIQHMLETIVDYTIGGLPAEQT